MKQHIPVGILRAFGLFLLNIIATAAGMGVPVFNVLLGFGTGVLLGRWAVRHDEDTTAGLRYCLRWAWLQAGFTLVMLVIIYWPYLPGLWTPGFDMATLGMPLVFLGKGQSYEAALRVSFVGWLVGVLVIAPLLQVLANLFSASVVLSRALVAPPDPAAEDARP